MHDTPDSAPSPDLRRVLSELPKVQLLSRLRGVPAQTPDTLIDQVRSHLAQLAEERIVYTELRILPELHTQGGLTLQEVVDCAVVAVEGADNPLLDARLILTTTRSGPVEQVAELAVRNHGRHVVGFGVTGPEADPLGRFTDAFRLLRRNYVPVVIDAGVDGSTESIDMALQLGAVRIGHGPGLIDDFHIDTEDFAGVLPGRVSGWVRDRHLTVDTAPGEEVARGLADSHGDHPLTLLQQLGFTCTVNAPEGSLTDEFLALAEASGYGLEEFFDLTVNAVRGSFLNEVERQDLLERVILPAYEVQDLEDGLDEFGGA